MRVGMKRYLVLAALSVLASWASNGAAQQPASGDAGHGKQVYLAVGCYTCHGRSGQGGNYNYPTPALAQPPWPLEAFRALLRAGPNDMPAYAEAVLSDRDVTDIYAFLQTLSGPRAVDGIELLEP